MATRTDIHRPSAPEFDPEAYDCLGVFDLFPDAGIGWGETRFRVETVNRALDQGYRFGGSHGMGQCGHCGTRIRYAALMGHRPTLQLIWVGETCLDNRFELTAGEFKALREAAALNRERLGKSARIEAAVAESPELAWLTYPEALTGEFTRDLAFRFRKDGRLSERQIAAVGPALARDAQFEDERLARVAAAEALRQSGVACPTGRTVVEGTVLTLRVQASAYGDTLKMLVAADAGWKVWGTVPTALLDVRYYDAKGEYQEEPGVEKGARVRFTATVEPSDDDPLFGFYKRPTKAEIVARP